MKMYSFTEVDLTATANDIKEAVLHGLEREGLLGTSAESLAAKYAVVVHNKGFFGKLIDKLTGHGDQLRVTFVKLV